MIMHINNALRRFANRAQAFRRDTKGAAAVEFAFVATLLITLYLGTQQISLSLNMNKKVGRAAASISELVSRSDNEDVPRTDLRDIMQIGAAVLQPYAKNHPTVTVTGIQIGPSGGTTVSFSQRLAEGSTYTVPFAKGSTISVPASLIVNDTFLVKVDVELNYQLITSWRTGQARDADGFVRLPMMETYYMRARNRDVLTCNDC
jgi:Flp pilus assembly protein TadG